MPLATVIWRRIGGHEIFAKVLGVDLDDGP